MTLLNFILQIASIIGFEDSIIQTKNFTSDTTIVARIIEVDSIFHYSNYTRTGFKYYYGVHHFRVETRDINNCVKDTVIIAYVYNMMTETELYKNNFNLKEGQTYLFITTPLKPCFSDFIKIQGICFDDTGVFYPESNKLINRYSCISRVIFSTEYKE